jgi:hypothetical protein
MKVLYGVLQQNDTMVIAMKCKKSKENKMDFTYIVLMG